MATATLDPRLATIHTATMMAHEAARLYDLPILVLGRSHHETREAFKQLRDWLLGEPIDAAEIRSTNGQERIGYMGGGTIHFASISGSGGRGLSVHATFMPSDMTEDQVMAVAPASHGRRMFEYGQES